MVLEGLYLFGDLRILKQETIPKSYRRLQDSTAQIRTSGILFVSQRELVHIRPHKNLLRIDLVEFKNPRLLADPADDPWVRDHAATGQKKPDLDRRLTPCVAFRKNIGYEVSLHHKTRHLLTGQRYLGSLVNISNGGACFRTRQRLQEKTILRIRIPVNKTFVRIPTLMEVRWVMKQPRSLGYRTGLRFII